MVAGIPCVIEGVSGHKECMGVVEPGSKYSEMYSAGALQTAVTVKDGRIPVRVLIALTSLSKCIAAAVLETHPLVDGDELPDKGVSEGYTVVRVAKENAEVDLGARQ